MPRKNRLDFPKLDPVPSDLDLVIGPAQTLDVAVGQVASQISGPIDAGARLRTEGIGKEFLRGQLRSPQIAPGQPISPNVQLAHHSNGDRLTILVQDIAVRVGYRAADEDRLVAVAYQIPRRPDGGLRWSIQVPQAAHDGRQSGGQVPRHGLARAHDLNVRSSLPTCFEQNPPGDRGGLQEGDTVPIDFLAQVLPVDRFLPTRHHQARPNQERQPHIHPRDVERDGRDREQAILGRQPEPLAHRPEQIGERPPWHLHSLGPAGGA